MFNKEQIFKAALEKALTDIRGNLKMGDDPREFVGVSLLYGMFISTALRDKEAYNIEEFALQMADMVRSTIPQLEQVLEKVRGTVEEETVH